MGFGTDSGLALSQLCAPPLVQEAANTLKQVVEAQKARTVKGRRRAVALGAVFTVPGKWYF